MAIVEVKVPQLSSRWRKPLCCNGRSSPARRWQSTRSLSNRDRQGRARSARTAAGVVAAHVVAGGGTVVSDQVIATIDTAGKVAAAPPLAAPAPVEAPGIRAGVAAALPRAMWRCQRLPN